MVIKFISITKIIYKWKFLFDENEKLEGRQKNY